MPGPNSHPKGGKTAYVREHKGTEALYVPPKLAGRIADWEAGQKSGKPSKTDMRKPGSQSK